MTEPSVTTTETTEEELADEPQAPAAAPEEEKDASRLRQRKPPSNGLCRRCGKNKPINRLMLCYPCWVKTELEKSGWREGQSHPDWCRCEGLNDHQRKSDSS